MSTTIQPEAPEATKEVKTRNHKPVYELAEGVKLEVTPEDFNPETHRMLRKQFKDTPCWKEHRAFLLEKQAAALRVEAEEWRKNPPKKGGTKRSVLVARLGKLEAKLKELGVNVEDLFADEDDE